VKKKKLPNLKKKRTKLKKPIVLKGQKHKKRPKRYRKLSSKRNSSSFVALLWNTTRILKLLITFSPPTTVDRVFLLLSQELYSTTKSRICVTFTCSGSDTLMAIKK
jgi:hypothetical protein